jgi:glycosyltransferase involved in cell wall biosynthesis
VREFVFLDDAPIFGGAERNVLRLARFLTESVTGRAVRVICPSTSELAARCRVSGIAVVDGRFPGFGPLAPLAISRAVGRLRRLLTKLNDDAVIVGVTLRSQVYAHAAILGLGRPLHIVHFLPEQDSARRLTAKLMLRRFGALVVVGENAARTYRARLGTVPVFVVNNFLLPEEFAAATRVTRPKTDEPPTLGVLARLIPEKGILELIFELSGIEGAWSRVVVAGERQDERYARTVEERIAALGFADRIRLLGPVNDLGPFFGAIDALVVPSVGNEGQPTVILEALAYGCPAIVREPVWSTDFNGLPVLPYRDGPVLAQRLRDLDRSTRAPRELAERFGPMQVLEALEAARTSITGARSPARHS